VLSINTFEAVVEAPQKIAKINEFETNRTRISETCRGVSVTKKGYQPTSNTVKDEKGCLVADLHSILTRWMNHFS
jgi:hypothetical protein